MVHIGIIPDGNRRWCRKNDYPLFEMTDKWMLIVNKKIDEILPLILNETKRQKYNDLKDINEVSLYVASIDNMKRNDGTIETIYQFIRRLEYKYIEIMDKLEKSKKNKILEYIDKISINIVGDFDLLPNDIKDICAKLSAKRSQNPIYIINVALAYDYEKDILNFSNNTNENYNRKQSKIDLIIRTGSEKRLSGFFPIQSIYAELFFLTKLWPEFDINDLKQILKTFRKRNRRFGM
jgi:undecaprenyl diphosphate synthase